MVRIADIAAIAVSLLVIGVFSVAAFGTSQDASYVEITSDQGVALYPLEQDTSVAVHGPLGHTQIRIEDGQAAIIDSPCREKLCIRAGHLHRNGQWAACMPNRVFVRITGGAKGELDALAF